MPAQATGTDDTVLTADGTSRDLPALESRVRHRLEQPAAGAGPLLLAVLATALTLAIGATARSTTVVASGRRVRSSSPERVGPRGPPATRFTSMLPV